MLIRTYCLWCDSDISFKSEDEAKEYMVKTPHITGYMCTQCLNKFERLFQDE